jgi:branched-chain amino acid transport system ATP-binding protein
VLEIIDLSKHFGGNVAVNAVSTTVEKGKINAIIGPNGAGKTTLFNLISGLHQPTSGQILFNSQDVTRFPADDMARLGVSRTFQRTALFDRSSVLDNLIVGHRLRTRSGLWDVLINSRRLQNEEQYCRDKARDALNFVGLSHLEQRMAGDLTQEQRKRAAFALALSTDPILVLLDEPASGVNPAETEGLAQLIRKMIKHGLTVCLIEHKLNRVMGLADKILVLDHGEKIAEGSPAEIRAGTTVLMAE